MSTPTDRSGPALLRRYDWRAAALGVLGSALPVLALLVLTRGILGWDFEEATRAPLATGQPWSPAYGGWFGSFAVLGWTFTAGVCAIGARLARRWQPQQARLLAGSAALSVLLLTDDLFLFHHTVAPQRLGIPKPTVLWILIAIAIVWGIVFRRQLLADRDLPILGWAVIAYGTSLWIDGFGGAIGWGGAREEVAKLTGVLAWAVFHWRVTTRAAAAGIETAGR
jgi:hypothetical protein